MTIPEVQAGRRVAAGRRFAGYAAIFDRVDRGGDVIRAGAFGPLAGRTVPLLWQHDRRRPIGTVDLLAEDAKGLRVIAAVADGVPVAAGAGLSFGYRVKAARRAASGRGVTVRELLALDLIEVSLVASPMQPLARVHAIEEQAAEVTPAIDRRSEDQAVAT